MDVIEARAHVFLSCLFGSEGDTIAIRTPHFVSELPIRQ